MGAPSIRIKGMQPIRLKFKFSYEKCFSFLLGLIWADRTLITYVRAVLIRIPYITDFREHIVSYVFLLALILSLPYMIKRIDPRLGLAYLIVACVYLANMVVFPNNHEALQENLVPFLIESLPLIFVGSLVDLKKQYRQLYIISLVSVIVKFVHLLLEPNNVINGDMNSSYIMLPHVCMVIVAALSRRDLLNISASLLGVFMIFSFGTRGPILCIFALVILYMILYKKIHKHIWFFCTVMISILCIIFFYDEIIRLFLMLIQKMGMSTRIIDMLISGDILESSGRNILQEQLMQAVSNNWFGYGIAGDRAIVGAYAHNILIELWVSFGVIVGTALFIVPVFFTVLLLIKKSRYNTAEDSFILVLISSCYVKLFLSGTYLTESFLFLLIGVLISEYRISKRGDLMIM